MADLEEWLHEKAKESLQRLDQKPTKPPIYLAVIFPIFLVGAVALVGGLVILYAQIHGIPRNKVPNLNGMLVALPAIFFWIPTALFLSNLVLYLVPPLRRIGERHTARTRGPGFVESQKFLLKALFFAALVCLPLIFLGFVL